MRGLSAGHEGNVVSSKSEQKGGRRLFFRESLARLIEPVGAMIEKRFGPLGRPVLLRPPGALAEAAFLETCHRCGACVDSCPASAIFAFAGEDEELAGTPTIDPNTSACVVCEGLQCTQACPSGALVRLDRPEEIRMGLAAVGETCVRHRNDPCTECVDRCPLGDSAISFVDAGPPEVRNPGCVGCGVCQQYCPVEPKAIVVAAMRQ